MGAADLDDPVPGSRPARRAGGGSCASAGTSRWLTARAAATCIAVGKLSLDDWPWLTWSLGWTGDLPPRLPVRISLARPAITSLAFMLDWVPEPVCQMTSGNWSSCSPAATSPAACWIASASSASSPPSRALTRAAACLTKPSAWTISDRHLLARAEREILDRALGLRAPIGSRPGPRSARSCRFRCGCWPSYSLSC